MNLVNAKLAFGYKDATHKLPTYMIRVDSLFNMSGKTLSCSFNTACSLPRHIGPTNVTVMNVLSRTDN